MTSQLKCVIEAERIQARIDEMARQISRDYEGKNVVCVCVLKGAYLFFADLMRRMTCVPQLEFVRLSTYRDGTCPSGELTYSGAGCIDLAGRHVLIVDDICDTGHSTAFLIQILSEMGPASLKTCALIDKHERRDVDLTVDYPGFRIEKGFLVGYGMDYAERYREMDAVYELVNT